MEPAAAAVVGLRFPPERRLAWYRAAGVEAVVGAYLIAPWAGQAAVGQVVVASGQCLSFGADPTSLPPIERPASADERPLPPPCAGRELLESLA